MNQINFKSLESIDSYHWQNIRLIATDMDGTLTQGEKFDAKLLQVLTQLSAAGIDVLISTGRSAGWVQAIATYLPVVGVANVVKYCDRLKYLPAYVTSKSEGEGFCELAALTLVCPEEYVDNPRV